MEMRRRWWVAGIVILSISIGGCLGPGNMEGIADTSTTAVSTTSTTFAEPEPQPNATVPPTHLFLTDCTGMAASMEFPSGFAPANPPGNWSPRRGVESEIFMLFFECQRIGFGQLERGPVHILFEGHTNFDPPASCKAGEYSTFAVLHAVWIDDADVVELVNSSYGVQTWQANFSVERNITASLQTVRWQWHVENLPVSEISIRQVLVDMDQATNVDRFVWFSGTDLWMLTLQQHLQLTNGDTHVAPGDLNEPTLVDQSGAPLFYSMGDMFLHAEATGQFEKFGGGECTRPQ